MGKHLIAQRARIALASMAAATIALVTLVTPPASASPALSSIVLSQALPGMVTAPMGPLNGPLTPSEVESWGGGNSAPTGALAQAIGNGQVSGYRRMWESQPPDGAFVQIIAAEMPSSGDAAVALGGADKGLSGNPFGRFSVPEIQGARGFTVTSNSSEGVVNQEVVSFAQGSILFEVAVGQVTTAANSDAPQVSQDDAIQIARQQAAVAPGSPTNPSNAPPEAITINFGEIVGAVLFIGGLVWLVIFLVRRSRRADPSVPLPAYWVSAPGVPAPGFPPPPPAPGGSPGLGITAAPGRAGTALLERPPASRPPGFYCSWCGSHVSIGGSVGHDCGPRDRPTAYCMGCGATFEDGATTCPACGNPRLQ